MAVRKITKKSRVQSKIINTDLLYGYFLLFFILYIYYKWNFNI